MIRHCHVRVSLGLIALAACTASPTRQAPATAPLYDNLGNHHHAITTRSSAAQRYFDQGLKLSYAFNHAEAIRAFQQGAALDPSCAMCYWGIAFALGPNINAPITEDAATAAWQAIEHARQLAGGATQQERAYIAALGRRYTANPKADRPPLDRAYADAMRMLARDFPDDLDAATLFAQSLMDTAPWNYWEQDGTPRSFTPEVLSTLESVLARQPDHPGAIHLYIHAVEASGNPGRAEKHADRLPALMPGAGHVVHMPAHIYLRVGRYGDASEANIKAIAADDAYFKGDAVAGNLMYQVGYYPHNIHFLVASASMEGRRAAALKAAREVRGNMHDDMLKDPAMGGMVQHYYLTPLYTMVRFGLWKEVLAEPPPAEGLRYMRAIWHAARGLAYADAGRLQDAEVERRALAAIKEDPSLEQVAVSSVNTASKVVAIAHEVLAGDLAAKRKRAAEAIEHFQRAVQLEDALTYMEPPDWPIPVRQLQGSALLELARAKEAEAAFRADMQKFPENGWSLSGLQASLERQGRTTEAAEVKKRLDRAWQRADVDVAGGRSRP